VSGDDKTKRQPSQTRFATVVIEESTAPPTGMPRALPVPRMQTPVGMPAPPPIAPPADLAPDRESYDDLEQVLRLERIESERATLLAQNQDLKQENALLRETTPTLVFPPASIPPPAPATAPSLPPLDINALRKAVQGSPLGRAAVILGIAAAIAWNAFNTFRAAVPEKRVDGLQARVSQNEQMGEKEIIERALEHQRTLQALRALECWGKQTRGGFQRQGLDLSSLPAGGIKALKLGDEDPNRPGPPRFIAEEKCPDFPKLPPEGAPR